MAFADDTVILSSSENWENTINSMNNYLYTASTWFKTNKLTINMEKTVFIPFSNYIDTIPKIICISIDGVDIKQVDSTKYLGIIIDRHLRWNEHTKFIINKTKYLLFIFSKLTWLYDTHTLMIIYYALFHSIITYGIIAWGGSNFIHIGILQHLQNRIIKIIKRNKFTIANYPLNIENSFNLACISHHYYELNIRFKQSKSITRRKMICAPKTFLKVSDKSSIITATRLFNSLPIQYKQLDFSKAKIKKLLKKWILTI